MNIFSGRCNKNRKNTPKWFLSSSSPLALIFMSQPVSKLPAYSCTLSPTLRVNSFLSDKPKKTKSDDARFLYVVVIPYYKCFLCLLLGCNAESKGLMMKKNQFICEAWFTRKLILLQQKDTHRVSALQSRVFKVFVSPYSLNPYNICG